MVRPGPLAAMGLRVRQGSRTGVGPHHEGVSSGRLSSPPHEAARDGDIASLRKMANEDGKWILVVRDNNGWVPVHVAARARPSPPTQHRLATRLTVFARADTSLIAQHAVKGMGRVDVLRFISEEFGRVSLTAVSREGLTAAHLAARGGHVDVLRFLVVTAGVDTLIVKDDDGWSPAHSAARAGHVDVLECITDVLGITHLMPLSSGGGPSLRDIATQYSQDAVTTFLNSHPISDLTEPSRKGRSTSSRKGRSTSSRKGRSTSRGPRLDAPMDLPTGTGDLLIKIAPSTPQYLQYQQESMQEAANRYT